MQSEIMGIHPRERLSYAMDLLNGASTVADIGCDHGRLSCALVQARKASRCIAIDISEPSLNKAARLARQICVEDRVETRLGDGLTPLAAGEADAIAILGMGGTLIAQILDVSPPLKGARVCVIQPMRAVEDIRRWLYERNYPVLADRVVLDTGRHYQVFSVGQPLSAPQPMPEYWPEHFFALGYVAFSQRDPQMRALTERMLATVSRKKKTQHAVALDLLATQLNQILDHWEGQS